MTDTITVVGFVTIEPFVNSHGTITGGKFVKVTQGSPCLENNQRAIRLSLTVPKDAFYPIADIAVEVPEALVCAPEVSVEAIS